MNFRSIALHIVVITLSLVFTANGFAGGGPENVALIVNAESDSSKLFANWYIQGRKIPQRNVIYLSDVPNREDIRLAEFKKSILEPILKTLSNRKLDNVDYIVYSADFPTMVRIDEHKKALLEEVKKQTGKEPDGRIFGPMASISALTYFGGAVLTDNPAYMLLDSNNYYRKQAQLILRRPLVGERQKEFEETIRNINGSEDEIQSAIQTLEEAVKRNPQQVALTYWLSKFYAQSGDFSSATKWMNRSKQLGWSFRKQTKADLTFDAAMKDPSFKQSVETIEDEPFEFAPTRGFKSQYPFAGNGYPNLEPNQGNRYVISTVLAVTRNYGNNEAEALKQLKITMQADESKPNGTFYFTNTSNVRSKARHPNVLPATEALERMGMKAVVTNAALPKNVDDIVGLTCGLAQFQWNDSKPAIKGFSQSKSKVRPGAICENLTSYGGIFWKKHNQTTLNAFVNNNAAGSSGTVTEPFAIQNKFPHPMIHAHYARGCSLGEAFYQSVHGPFQLLIVGDALCQPWATKPQISISGIQAGEKISGTKTINIDDSNSPVSISGMELYIDGKFLRKSELRKSIQFDSKSLTDGFHEIRVVAIASGPIETVGHAILPFEINNFEKQITLELQNDEVNFEDTVTINASTNFGDSIELMQNFRTIGKKKGKSGEFKIPAKLLGRGPVKLSAIAISKKGNRVASKPLEFEVVGPVYVRRDDTITPPAKRAKDGKMVE